MLAAWDDEANREGDMIGALAAPMEALREALARKPGRPMREPGSPPRPREGTKLMAVLAMLRRPEGATVAQVGEALTLRCGMLDLPRRTARLPDTKTGESVWPLASAACDLLRKLGPGRADALVFPPSRGDGIMSGFPTLFERITKAGGLPKDVTPHILRHSFASLAADLGCSELAIAALLGHRSGSVTARYTHAADDVLLAVADRVGAATLRKMAGEGSAEVVAGPGVQQEVA